MKRVTCGERKRFRRRICSSWAAHGRVRWLVVPKARRTCETASPGMAPVAAPRSAKMPVLDRHVAWVPIDVARFACVSTPLFHAILMPKMVLVISGAWGHRWSNLTGADWSIDSSAEPQEPGLALRRSAGSGVVQLMDDPRAGRRRSLCIRGPPERHLEPSRPPRRRWTNSDYLGIGGEARNNEPLRGPDLLERPDVDRDPPTFREKQLERIEPGSGRRQRSVETDRGARGEEGAKLRDVAPFERRADAEDDIRHRLLNIRRHERDAALRDLPRLEVGILVGAADGRRVFEDGSRHV